MIIGVPRELKNNESRVALTPAGVMTLSQAGHTIIIEHSAGVDSGFSDDDYQAAGAMIYQHAENVWNESEMIMKVKEPLPEEYYLFREDLILFTYLHLAAVPDLAKALTESKMTSIAYETVEEDGHLPLLTPMSEVAGRMASQIGAQFLEAPKGGSGVLLSGVPGVKRGKVTIIGGGVVGTNAAKIAMGLGADVTIMDLSHDRLRQLDDMFGTEINTLMSNPLNIAHAVKEADLVIGAVLIPGARAPRLITEEMIKEMKPGSVIVDVAIDQGGIVETIDHITTHDDPIYKKHDVVHYAVANMPGAVPRTSTLALTNVTVPYALHIANYGIHEALHHSPSLVKGVNTASGNITYEAVAEDLGYEFVPVERSFRF
ncbi:alanine dehydrogenase [Salisediminibacterium halotolerans]|uniref:Alanine dehydrogenase n=1 Tax=Salisediminibacterium halotolerans TaxID=517425 RepID=A0A1H9WUH2_9BACI|nr:alanine dehydrogenase [Salisediminibacterium haloalkalitolerans]SES37439.1 alanine dehydrogenase [Salisediminibacterium haloalkalitolerans]